MLRVDQILNNGRFRVTRFVGEDESGTMHEAVDAVSDSTVMLLQRPRQLGKVTTQSQLNEMNAAFESAVDSLIRLRHDRIVAIRGRFTEIDNQFLILEPIERMAAEMLTNGDRRPTLNEIYGWAVGLLSAIDYLHSQTPAVILGDINPRKIALTANGGAKLLLTSAVTGDTANAKPDATGTAYKPIEKIWQTLGPTTRRVLSRDQDDDSTAAYDEPLDARSDIYSLAASVYHLLTGVSPCDSLERAITILDGKPDPLRAPSELDPVISPMISTLLVKALSIKREDRFASASVMLRVFETGMNSHTPAVEIPVADPIHLSMPQVEPEMITPIVVEESAIVFETVDEHHISDVPVFELSIDDSEEDLLEIDPAPISVPPPIAITPPLPKPIAENIVTQNFETARIPQAFSTDSSLETYPAAAPKTKFAAMAAAAALLVTVGVVAFNFMSGGVVTSQAESIAPPVVSEPAVQTEPLIAVPDQSQPETSETTTTAAADPKPATDEPKVERTVSAADKNNRPQAVAQTDKSKKPEPERTPKPKKPLTVDDLLSDN